MKMAFWKHVISNIHKLLDKKDVTLEEILNESDILQELRGQSPKLLKFLLQPSHLEQLVDFIIHDPDPQLDYKYQYKLPNIACEVLTFDIAEINDALKTSPYLLTKICNVFRQEDALNDLTASFVCKLLIHLATKCTGNFLDFIQYYDPELYIAPKLLQHAELASAESVPMSETPECNPINSSGEPAEAKSENSCDEKSLEETPATEPQQAPTAEIGDSRETSSLVDILLNHINNSAVKDLINKMVMCTDNPELRPDVVRWLANAQLVSKLVAMLSSDNSEQVVTNSAKCLCKIIKVGREHQISLQEKCPPDPLLDAIEDPKTITEILDHAIAENTDSTSAWTLFESNFILLSLLQYKKAFPTLFDLTDTCFVSVYGSAAESSPMLGDLDNERAVGAIKKCLAALVERLPAIIANLTFDESEKFGTIRLEIVKLIGAMITCADDDTLVVLRDLKVLPIIMKLFFAYPLCSQLHNQVDIIVRAICTPPRNSTPVNPPPEKKFDEDDEDEDDEKKTTKTPTDVEMTEVKPSGIPVIVETGVAASTENPAPKHILFDQLVTECAILERILDHYKTIPKEQKGYNGHIRLIANYIEGMADNAFAKHYNELMGNMQPALRKRWTEFRENLNSINRIYAKTIDTPRTTTSCSESDDPEELRDIGMPTADAISSAQQSFNEYQRNQLTASAIDKFGFEDAEFTDIDHPGITNVVLPPTVDDSSDEDSENDEGTVTAESCDPWNEMDKDFNPWDLASSSATSKNGDDWADFGSVKTDLMQSGNAAMSEKQGSEEDEGWAAFASSATNATNDVTMTAASPAGKQNGSDDDEF